MRCAAGRPMPSASVYEGEEFSALVRLGQVETLKESGSRALGLRVFNGLQHGFDFDVGPFARGAGAAGRGRDRACEGDERGSVCGAAGGCGIWAGWMGIWGSPTSRM